MILPGIYQKFILVLILLTAILLSAVDTRAHALGPNLVRLDIRQESPRRYSILWKDPSRGLKTVFPADCLEISKSSDIFPGDTTLVECTKSLQGRKVTVIGPNADALDLMVRLIPVNIDDEEDVKVLIFRGADNIITMVEEPTALEVAKTYLLLGMEHIFAGIDHLLFVLGLLLILTGWRQLFFTITAFTVAHSITLALATLGVITIPQAPVEAGQLIFVSSVLLFINLATRCLKKTPSWTEISAAYGIGSVAAFWFWQRTFAICF